MDNMVIDTINGGDVDAYVLGGSYTTGDVTLSYAYGNFERDATNTLPKEAIIEHNFAAEYAYNEHLTLFAIVTVNNDKEDTATNAINNSGDFTNVRVSASYNF
jgi:predicted porin